MAKKKKDVAKKLVVGTVVAATLANPITTIVYAASDTAAKSNYSSLMTTEDDSEKDIEEEFDEDTLVDGDSEIDSDEENGNTIEEIEAIAGVSVEQMQADFLAAAQNATEAIVEETPSISLLSLDQSEDQEYMFLSNIPYDSTSNPGYKEIQVDKNIDGGSITLRVGGEVATFKKGMAAHATSNLIYDVSAYTAQYPVLDTYMGIDAAQGTKGNVKFTIYGSNDKTQWDVLFESAAVTAADEAIHVNIDVSKYQYIKLHANQNGVAANDHAVYGGLKLATKDYTEAAALYQNIKTLAEYDAELSKHSAEYNYEHNKHMVLEREFVRRIGYRTIQNAYLENRSEVGAMLNWLLTDSNALELFIEAGDYFAGSGYRAFSTLCTLYTTYKEDVNNTIHKKMLLATAAAFSRDVRNYFVDFGTQNFEETRVAADPVERYRIMKKLYDEGRFVKPSEFENYPMELIRIVVGARLADDEIEWFRDYIDLKYGNDINNTWRYGGYGYTHYAHGNLANPDFYNADSYAKWDEKYKLTGTPMALGVDRGYGTAKLARIWMMLEAGGICWGISGIGTAACNLQGVAALHTYQPNHEAEMSYREVNGKGTWVLSNNVHGWPKSYTVWGNMTAAQVRLPLQWGVMDFNGKSWGNNSTYIILAQDAFNNYDAYKQSMYYALIANSYNDDNKVDAYKKSLQAYNKNVDATYGLIKYYKSVESTTQETWLALATDIAENYKFFPAPMVDLLNLVKDNLTNDTYIAQLNTLQATSLQRATTATENDTTQPADCKNIANSLLGANVVELATFSFDGEDANTVKLNSVYDNSELAIRISLDGGQSWLTFDRDGREDIYTSAHSVKLTDDQVAQITAENDILVGLMGVPVDSNYRIDIKEGASIANNIYKNDSENLLIGGNTSNLEYSTDGGSNWHDYESGLNSNTRLDGNVTALFRYKQYGQYLAGPVKEFIFTENTDTDKAKYIPLMHVSLYKYSSQQNGTDKAAANIIDGNYNTRWHTTWDKPADTEKYISFEFDQVKFISKIAYLAYDRSGEMKSGNVYTSLDGEHWEKVYTYTGLPSSTTWKVLDLGDSYPAKYVKIDSTESHYLYNGQQDLYFAGRMLEFYEDTTKVYEVNAEVTYDIPNDKKTNQNVTATLILPEGCEAVTETTHVFETNDTYTFVFKDILGLEHSIEAAVDWIDKEAPTAQIEYSTTNPTNGSVEAKLVNISEKVTGETSYVFTQNGTHKFVITDEAGNTAEYTAEVTWIKTEGPTLSVSFDKDKLTNTDVVATLGGYSETDTILDGSNGTYRFEKNGTYTFRVQDELGNISELFVTVDWIDKEAPTAQIEYSTTSPTNGSVEVKLVNISEKVTGETSYVFTQNGTHRFVITDEAGNTAEYIAVVSWIKTEGPVLSVSFDKDKLTNTDVVATLGGYSETDTILDGSNGTYRFEKNGTYTFRVQDEAGNISELLVTVDWIDKEAPTANVVYSEDQWTSEDVRASLQNISENVVFLDGSNGEHVFTDNGTYTFVIQDAAGNIAEYTAEVKWIDKTRPEGIALFSFDTDDENNVETVNLNIDLNKVEILSVNGDETNQSAKMSRNGMYTFRMRMIDTGYEFEYTISVACIGMQEPTFVGDGNAESGADKGNVSLVGKPVQQPSPTPNPTPTPSPIPSPTPNPTPDNSDKNTENNTTTSSTTSSTTSNSASSTTSSTTSSTASSTTGSTSSNSTVTGNATNNTTTGTVNNGTQATSEAVVDKDEIVISKDNTESNQEDSSTESNSDQAESETSSEVESTSQTENTEANTTVKDENKGGILPVIVGGASITGLIAAGAVFVKKYFLLKFFKK